MEVGKGKEGIPVEWPSRLKMTRRRSTWNRPRICSVLAVVRIARHSREERSRALGGWTGQQLAEVKGGGVVG
ncbi:hypothetical protein GUJ93_ZPchr0011g27787 [Zizania palustris]|uniref:Uncharacterized protein n=1 Tax=Zizania palustris TaxID=103762 RepID=A0A8J6BKD5_ZIZPA|nr:hypothetical protein GUJ93_ZPchr0011g27787 [Zizania palustris]